MLFAVKYGVKDWLKDCQAKVKRVMLQTRDLRRILKTQLLSLGSEVLRKVALAER
jgi:hypothetical protein